MTPANVPINFDDLHHQLEAIEEQSHYSTLAIYRPSEEHKPFYINLCQTYLDAPYEQRTLIRDAVSDRKGILNRLLGFVYEAAEQVRATKDVYWLRMGLAAAAIENSRLDWRDSLTAMAELYVTAEEVGIDPKPEFEAAGGGVPANFHTYAVVGSRRAESKKRLKKRRK